MNNINTNLFHNENIMPGLEPINNLDGGKRKIKTRKSKDRRQKIHKRKNRTLKKKYK